LQLEQRVLNEELVRERSIERHFGPVVQVTHPSRVAAFQFESDETKPDFYQKATKEEIF
jgi:hypothetical protein